MTRVIEIEAASDEVVLVGADQEIEKVDYVFDRQGKPTERRAKSTYEQLRVTPLYHQAEYIGNIDYRDDKDFEGRFTTNYISLWQPGQVAAGEFVLVLFARPTSPRTTD